jgi:hypothetical protein
MLFGYQAAGAVTTRSEATGTRPTRIACSGRRIRPRTRTPRGRTSCWSIARSLERACARASAQAQSLPYQPHSTLRQQILDVTQAKSEPKIEEKNPPIELRRETLSAAVELRHPAANITGLSGEAQRIRDNVKEYLHRLSWLFDRRPRRIGIIFGHCPPIVAVCGLRFFW